MTPGPIREGSIPIPEGTAKFRAAVLAARRRRRRRHLAAIRERDRRRKAKTP